MEKLRDYRSLLFIWLAWALGILALVQFIPMRLTVQGPDTSLTWTAGQTQPGTPQAKPYLVDPFMNGHVAWDSEYYLSIAVGGYDDPAMRAIPQSYNWGIPEVATKAQEPSWTSMNYAFFPGYPLTVWVVMKPFTWAGMAPIPAATLAGVLVSLLGALAAMAGIYRLGRGLFDSNAGHRAAFYLLISPASMFLAMVYTEGLFLGLTFLALASARDRNFPGAGFLSFAATLTKAAGGLLLVPLVLYWYLPGGQKRVLYETKPRELVDLAFCMAPVVAYGIFTATLGPQFHFIETTFFNRSALALGQTVGAWSQAFGLMGTRTTSLAYYLVELGAMGWTIVSLVWIAKKDKVLALYSSLVFLFSLTTGVAMGMHRYVMAVPSFFLLPAFLGKSRAFDRGWVLVNLPVCLVFLICFIFNLWAG